MPKLLVIFAVFCAIGFLLPIEPDANKSLSGVFLEQQPPTQAKPPKVSTPISSYNYLGQQCLPN